MMICTKCGQKSIDGSSFCNNCGAPLSATFQNRELSYQQSNEPVGSGGVGMPREGMTMDQPEAKKSKKIWIWGIGIVLIIVACCCLVALGGGFFYLRNQGQTVQDLISSGSETPAVVPEALSDTPIPVETVETVSPIDTMEPQTEAIPADTILVVTYSGIWAVNDQTLETVQISIDHVDSSWDLNLGLSPDKKFYAYITGFGGASDNPTLVVLDIQNRTPVLNLELSGSTILGGAEGTLGAPVLEAYRAIQSDSSFAWSPDGTRLAFTAAVDSYSADIYLFNLSDSSVTRLTDEAGHATAIHWSPDGRFLQYTSVISFGTGAGMEMEGLWVFDFESNQARLLEALKSNGEDFLAWTDNSHFLISSWGRICGGSYNLRMVDAAGSEQQVIVNGGFTAVAYDPENKFGMLSVAYNYENCGSSEILDAGLMIFGESVPVLGADGPIAGEIGLKKFEQTIAYGIGFLPAGNLFTVYGDAGLQAIYYKGQYGYNSMEIRPEVKGLVPFPAPNGETWAWAARSESGLWVTESNENPVKLSTSFSGVPLWDEKGQTLYFFENSNLYSASAPQFNKELLAEISGEELLGVIK